MANNIYIKRTNSQKPFSKQEFIELLSSDFEVVDIYTNNNNGVTSFVIVSKKYKELSKNDIVSEGLEFTYQNNGVYAYDPRFLSDEDYSILTSEVLEDLCVDLEAEIEYEF